MKPTIGNSHFRVHFDSDGAARPFLAARFWQKAGRDKVRRQFFPAHPSVFPRDAELEHLRSSFQIFDEHTQTQQSGWKARGHDIVARQEWSADDQSLGAVARLRLKDHAPARSVRVRWTFPHPYLPSTGIGSGVSLWQVWAAHLNAPFADGWGHLVFTHGRCPDVANEIVLPAITLYRRDVDLGFTFFLDQEVPWITRIELDQRQHLIAFEFSHVGLRPGQTAEIALRFFCHRGCWRTGLAAIQGRFPRATRPLSKQSRKYEGVMAYTIPSSPRMLRVWRDKMGLKFNEILHFDDFGQYAPAEPWNCRNVWSPRAPWRKVDGMTWARLRDYVRSCKDLGIGAFLYINFADCESRLARRRYAGAILRNELGKEMITWVYPDQRRHCLMINPDPQFGFASSILEQARQILERLPELDGFHLDQNGYGWIDTAHDDGVTMLNNRPAYNMLCAYRRVGKLFRKLCDDHGKLIESNGLIHFRQLEDVDMLMAEQSLSALARFGPICSQRALLYLATGEQGFQWSLRYGSFPHVSPYEWAPPPKLKLDPKTAAIYRAYLPIASLLRGATWVLEPDCLRLPQQQPDENVLGNIAGNFYRLADGDNLVTLLQAPHSVLNTTAVTKEFPKWDNRAASVGLHQEEIQRGFLVTLRFAAAKFIRVVRLLHPNQPPVSVKWSRSGNCLRVTVPQLGAFGALRLSR